MYSCGRLTTLFDSPSFQTKPATPTDKTPAVANTSSPQPASLSSDPAALRPTPGSSSRAKTTAAAPAFKPALAPIPTALALTQDNDPNVPSARPDSPAALNDVTTPRGVSPDTPVATEPSTSHLTSDQTPAVASKKATRPRRVGPKTVSAPENPQTSAPTRRTRKTATTEKAPAPKETTANATKKAKTSKKVCPGR